LGCVVDESDSKEERNVQQKIHVFVYTKKVVAAKNGVGKGEINHLRGRRRRHGFEGTDT
jgi:hypothetical protein